MREISSFLKMERGVPELTVFSGTPSMKTSPLCGFEVSVFPSNPSVTGAVRGDYDGRHIAVPSPLGDIATRLKYSIDDFVQVRAS